MAMPPIDEKRLHELLADQALFELTADEQAELSKLLASSSIDPASFDYLAALAALALLPDAVEPLPANVTARVAKDAEAFLAERQNRQAAANAAVPDRPLLAAVVSSPSRRFAREFLPWLIAAASTAALLLVTWRTDWQQPVVKQIAVKSVAESRSSLLKQAPDAVEVRWTAAGDPSATGASGDVVWSVARQEGVLRFKGLAKNDPQKDQYQLWIFDGHQDERYPIDGGVFNVDAESGDVIVPIHAELHVADPKMFAVTLEKPGGVVVSNRKRLALVAKVPPRKA